MIFWPWSKKKSKNSFIVIEIGSSSVSAALFSLDPQKQEDRYHVISTSHAEICARESDISVFVDGIGRAFGKVIDDLERGQGETPAACFCVLSSPLLVSHTTQVTEEREKSFSVSEKMILELADRQAKEVRDSEPLLYAGLAGDRNIIIESKVMQVRLNDYEIKQPFGKQAKKVTFHQFVSIGSEQVISLLSKIIRERLRIDPEFHSFAYCEYNALRHIYHLNDNFLVIDVGGEITDLTTVAAGRIVDTASFSLGQRFLTRWLAESWPTNETEMSSILRLYLNNKVEITVQKKIELLLGRIRGEWMKELHQVIARSAEREIIPAKIFLIGNSEESQIFLRWIGDEDLSAYTFASKGVDVEFIDHQAISAFYTGDITRLKDTFLLVDTMFCGKIFKAKNLNI